MAGAIHLGFHGGQIISIRVTDLRDGLGGFTDTEISGSEGQAGQERQLTKWEPEEGDASQFQLEKSGSCACALASSPRLPQPRGW